MVAWSRYSYTIEHPELDESCNAPQEGVFSWKNELNGIADVLARFCLFAFYLRSQIDVAGQCFPTRPSVWCYYRLVVVSRGARYRCDVVSSYAPVSVRVPVARCLGMPSLGPLFPQSSTQALEQPAQEPIVRADHRHIDQLFDDLRTGLLTCNDLVLKADLVHELKIGASQFRRVRRLFWKVGLPRGAQEVYDHPRVPGGGGCKNIIRPNASQGHWSSSLKATFGIPTDTIRKI